MAKKNALKSGYCSSQEAFKIVRPDLDDKKGQQAKKAIKKAMKSGAIAKDTVIESGRWTQYKISELKKLVSKSIPMKISSKPVSTNPGMVFSHKKRKFEGSLIVEVPASDQMLVEKFGWTILRSL